MNGQAKTQARSGYVRNAKAHIGTEKRCSKCGVRRAISEYSPDNRALDGLQSQCRVCRGIVNRPYQKARKTKAREIRLQQRALLPPKKCSVDGCNGKMHGDTWCSKHYFRVLKHGDLFYREKPRYRQCIIPGCDKAIRSGYSQYCETHYYRIRRNGTTELRPRKKRFGKTIQCAVCGITFTTDRKIVMCCSKNCGDIKAHNKIRKYPTPKERCAAFYQRKKNSDVKYILNSRIRCAIWQSLRDKKKDSSWWKILGYTVEMLERHIENKFTLGMSWDKFLTGDIHIDHIIPIKAFNFINIKDIDFKRCWSINNLRPMWAIENIKKGAKLDKPFQPALRFSMS